MANKYYGNPIELNDFSAEIKFSTIFSRYGFKLLFIKWQKPTVLDNIAKIKMDANTYIFNEKCKDLELSLIQYFHGMEVPDIIIPVGEVSAGETILIGLK